jgi:hypothetical protein
MLFYLCMLYYCIICSVGGLLLAQQTTTWSHSHFAGTTCLLVAEEAIMEISRLETKSATVLYKYEVDSQRFFHS